jgi:hypothetical protein
MRTSNEMEKANYYIHMHAFKNFVPLKKSWIDHIRACVLPQIMKSPENAKIL